MGFILWIAVRLLHILKPFVKIALIESLIEALTGIVDGDATPTDASED